LVLNPLSRAEHRRLGTDQPAAPKGIKGVAGMPRVLRRGWEAPSENPVPSLRSAGNERMWGGLFFGFFLLAEQKKGATGMVVSKLV